MISRAQFIEMQARVSKTVPQPACKTPTGDKEVALHNEIIEFCNAQWPRWKYIHARTDRRSTIATGAQDFTIFLPNGRFVCIECKRPNEKPTQDQLEWACEMRMLEITVHVVHTMDEFRAVLRDHFDLPSFQPNPPRN